MRVFASVHAIQPLLTRYARHSMGTTATSPHQPDYHRTGGKRGSSKFTHVHPWGFSIGLPNPTVLSWRRDRYNTEFPSLRVVGVHSVLADDLEELQPTVGTPIAGTVNGSVACIEHIAPHHTWRDRHSCSLASCTLCDLLGGDYQRSKSRFLICFTGEIR
jgi:hypothetical protein